LGSEEFQLSLDRRAFEFNFLLSSKFLRVTQLGLDGKWTEKASRDAIYTKESPYIDEYIEVIPDTKSFAKLKIKKEGTSYLYLKSAPKSIICNSLKIGSVLYINLILKKQHLKPGTYDIQDDSFILTPDGIRLLNLPTGTRPMINEIEEKSFDPVYLFMASAPLR